MNETHTQQNVEVTTLHTRRQKTTSSKTTCKNENNTNQSEARRVGNQSANRK